MCVKGIPEGFREQPQLKLRDNMVCYVLYHIISDVCVRFQNQQTLEDTELTK